MIIPQCFSCKRYDREDPRAGRCEAFPAGIPDAILLDGADHTVPFPGDHGLRFERDTRQATPAPAVDAPDPIFDLG